MLAGFNMLAYLMMVLKKAIMLEVNGQRKRGRPKITLWRQVEESETKVGLHIEDAAD